jgi:ATP-binding cassette subfamily C protein CydCD
MILNRRLWAFTAGFRGRIAFSILLGLIGTALSVAQPILIGWLVTRIITDQQSEVGILVLLTLSVVIVLHHAVEYWKEGWGFRTSAYIERVLYERLIRKTLELGSAQLARHRTGDLLTALVEGARKLESFYSFYIPQLFTTLIAPIAIYIWIALLDLPTAIIYILAAAASILTPTLLTKAIERASDVRREAYTTFAADFLDSLQGLATLQAFGQTGARLKLLAARSQTLFKATMRLLAVNAGTTVATSAFTLIGYAIALTWGAVRVGQGDMTLDTLLIILLLGTKVFEPIQQLASLYHSGMYGLSAAQSVFALLDDQPLVCDLAATIHDLSGTKPAITFEKVSFAYPNASSNALAAVSFSIHDGERIGIVGKSGAGKSTLMWLLQRLYDPTNGRILLNGFEMRELTFAQIRDQIAVVAQDTYLFNGTVADNLRLGKPDATLDELIIAARNANAHEFIQSLPDGYDTPIGERGVRLSGGQRQRIAIARALLRNAPILVLDEATSSVDAENEAIIQEALDRLTQGRLTLIMAHRLSSVIDADRILVLERGQLVENGTHRELLAHGGIYARLMADQAVEAAQTIEGETEDTRITIGTPDGEIRRAETGAILEADKATRAETIRVLSAPLASRKLQTLFSIAVTLTAKLAGIGIGVTGALIIRALLLGESPGVLPFVLVGLTALTIAATWYESWVAHGFAFTIIADLRIQLFKKLDALGAGYLHRRRTGDLVGIATKDAEEIELFYAHYLQVMVVAAILPLFILGLVAAFDIRLLITILPFLLLLILPVLFSLDRRKTYDRVAQKYAAVNAHAVDTVQGLREIIAFQQEEARIHQFLTAIDDHAVELYAFFRKYYRKKAIIHALVGLGAVAVVVVCNTLVDEGTLDRSLLLVLIVISLAAFTPVSDFSVMTSMVLGFLNRAARMAVLLKEPVEVTDGVGVHANGSDGSIRFEQVAFQYDYSKRSALNDVSFDIPPGGTVALVGSSGAGKTTLAHLLLRFYDPSAGRILLAGHNLRDYHLLDLRERVALVSQDTYLFNTTIRDNLRIASPTATDADLRHAIQQAGLTDFIASLPDGLDTPIGERGAQLSGGQRQRLAIARAFLKNAPILILDEATSHLDAVNERLVREALAELQQNRTTLIIAHRLSTVRDANLIVVMDNGQVVEMGSHDDLLLQRGRYAHLVMTQLTGALPNTPV